MMSRAPPPLAAVPVAASRSAGRSKTTIQTHEDALRVDALIDKVHGGTFCASARTWPTGPVLTKRVRSAAMAGPEELARLASQCAGAREAVLALANCPWDTKNKALARLALSFVRAFELKVANELADALHCAEPYSPPSVLASPLEPLSSSEASSRPAELTSSDVSDNLEVEALALPWGAPAAGLLPSPAASRWRLLQPALALAGGTARWPLAPSHAGNRLQ